MAGPIIKKGLCGCSLTSCVISILLFEMTALFAAVFKATYVMAKTCECHYEPLHHPALASPLNVCVYGGSRSMSYEFLCMNRGVILSCGMMTATAQIMMFIGIKRRHRSFMLPYLCVRFMGVIFNTMVQVAILFCCVLIFHLDVLTVIGIGAILLTVIGMDIFLYLHMVSLYNEYGLQDHEVYGVQELVMEQQSSGKSLI